MASQSDMSKRCDYCAHTKSFHRDGSCVYRMSESEYCDCEAFTEIQSDQVIAEDS